MTRLAFGGAESQSTLLENLLVTGTVNIDTTTPRSGLACFEFPSGAGNRLSYQHTNVNNRQFYGRAWIYFSANPAVDTIVASWSSTTNNQESVTLKTNGTMTGPDGTATSVLSAGYHCVEIALKFDGTNWVSDCKIDGVTLGAQRTHNPGLTPNRFNVGNVNGAAHAVTIRADDWAVNDDQGSAQTSWCGTAGKVLLSKPTADSAAGSDWKLGTGTANGGNAHNSVDNVPPTGKSNATAADGDQIKDGVSNTSNPNADADLTMQSYTVAGASGSVTVTQALAAISGAQSTAVTVGTKIVSNPADASESTLATGSSSAGTFPTNWRALFGLVTSGPAPTLGTAPVMRVGKRTASTNTCICCFAGVHFEYEPPTTTTVAIGEATETDIAQPVTRLKVRVIGRSTETDTAQPVTRFKVRATAQATETDIAQPVTRLKVRAIGRATETEIAQPFTVIRSKLLGQPAEADAAQPFTLVKGLIIGQAATAESAQPFVPTKIIVIGQAVEVSSADAFALSKALSIGQAEEIDEAQPFSTGDVAHVVNDGYTDATVGVVEVDPAVPGIVTAPTGRY